MTRCAPQWLRSFTGLLLIATLIAGCARQREAFETAPTFEGTFATAAVAADHHIASAAGAEILAMGGNAVDAAVATSFTLSVVRPMSCGIGGGGFMVIKFNNDPKHGDRAVALNYRETTPAAIGPDFYESDSDKHASTVGARAVAIPGTVRGLMHALENYGTLDRATVLAPAIRAAREGFIVDAYYIDGAKERVKWFNEDESRKTRFAFVWQRFLREGNVRLGDRIKLPEQAAALELIARDGADAFYNGPIADAIIRAIQHDGGVMTADDLQQYAPVEVTPIRVAFMQSELITMPPPSSGGIVLSQVLQVLGAQGAIAPPTVTEPYKALHTLVEALKHAFADRATYLADPGFVKVPTQMLLSTNYLNAFKILPTTQPHYGTDDCGNVLIPTDDSGTSHLSVIDALGNAVACTETINLEYGSKLAVPEFGFCLNNEMDDFTTRRGAANAFNLVQSDRNLPQPGKRPLSSMSPTIVLDEKGDVFMIVGASGGPRIITGTLQVILNVILKNRTAGEAVAAPRIHHQWQPDVLYAEPGALSPAVMDDLKRRGHRIEPTGVVGNVQLIRKAQDGRGWNAASDPRKGGRPAGF